LQVASRDRPLRPHRPQRLRRLQVASHDRPLRPHRPQRLHRLQVASRDRPLRPHRPQRLHLPHRPVRTTPSRDAALTIPLLAETTELAPHGLLQTALPAGFH
jgi:hypothetical protein